MGNMDCAKRQWRLIGGNLALVQVKSCFVNHNITRNWYSILQRLFLILSYIDYQSKE